jgi:imidazolonepropionase-like amidohydrolase
MTGEILEQSSILIEDGIIKGIDDHIETPVGCEVIDATGKFVFPGFIDAHCHVGTFGSGVGEMGIDVNEMTDPITPHVRAIDGINPRDESIEQGARGGITTVATGPGSGNVVGGTFLVMKMHGHRIDDMIIKNPLAMKCAFGENPKRVYGEKGKTPMTRMGTAANLRELLLKTIEYKNKTNIASEAGDISKMPTFDIKLEAMLPVINKEIPLKAHAHQADDIFTAIRIAKEFDLKLTLDHCSEGHLIANDLAKEGYPAIVGPTFGWKSKFELRNKSFDTPKILVEAGVKVAIMTDSPIIPIEGLTMSAALAHKAGLDIMEALKCITINPAEILGIDERVGSIEIGKDADIVIWDRHPFDLQASPEYTIIDGEVVFRAG